jgi:hypothetical protein
MIGKEEYESLQEIDVRFVKECSKRVIEVSIHPKFRNCNSIDDLKEFLEKEKEKTPGIIPYKFTILPEFPQFVVLGYITPSSKFTKEYIKVKP